MIQVSGSGSATITAGSSANLTITALTSAGAQMTGMNQNVTLSFYGLSSSPSNNAPAVTDMNGTTQPVTASVGTPNTTITFVNGVATVNGANNGVLKAYNGTGAAVTLNCSDGTATSASGTGAAGLSLTVNTAASSQLVFTTSAQSMSANTLSGTITVQRQDSYGNPNTTDAAVTVNLTSTSGTGVFWNTGHTATLTSVTINTGSSAASFKYEDSATGAPTITAADAAAVLTSATQMETIAQTLTWLASPATYSWNTSDVNWTGGNGIYANGDAVTFNDTGSASSPINLAGTLSPVAVTVNTSSKNYTFSTTGSGTISGSAPLLKSGGATLTISTANSYTGPTTVSGGVVDVQNSTALGAGATTVSSNAAVQVDGSGLAIGEAITLNGPGITNGGALRNLANANTWSGAITLASDSRINSDAGSLTLSGGISSTAANLTVGGSGNVTNTGTIATSGMLTKDGSGTLSLVGNNNTYSGGTLISAGVVGISGDGDLGVAPSSVTATNIILDGGDLLGSVNDAVLDANRGIGIGPTNGSLGTNALIDAAAGQTFTVSGIIASSGNTGVNNLIVNSGAGNTGTVILGGANTFNGTTVISNGLLQVANTLALQDSTVNLNNQGGSLVFDPSVSAATLSALTGDQDLGLTNLSGGAVTLSVGNSATTTYAGGMVDAGLGGGLTLNGTGTFILTGDNTYTGATTINTGTLELSTGGVLGGSSLTLGIVGSGTFFLNGGAITSGALNLNASGNVADPGTVTINSGMATFTSTTIGNNQNGGGITINGGTVSLGAFNDKRDASVNGAASLTTGLVIAGGTVTAASVNVSSGNSGGDLTITNGSLTIGNSSTIGGFEVGTGSSTTRGGFLTVSGGALTYNGTDGLLINNGAAATVGTAAFTGGASTLTGITLNGNAGGTSTLTISGSAAVYLGSVGLVENSGTSTINLTGGTIGAVASWSSSAPLTLGGTLFQTADASGDPFSITLNGALTGTGNLNVTGGGTLTLGAANTYSGSTLINGGTLALSSGASVTSTKIFVGSNTTFDVSQVSGGFTLNGGQTLSGYGTVNGAVAAASGSTIYPGSNGLTTGTLTLNGGLTESGGAVNEFILSSNPLGAGNDFLSVPGGLTVSGTNTIFLLGTMANGSAYPLIYYGASPGFSGSTNNFTVTGAPGVISNSAANHTLYFVAMATLRGPANTTWLGNSLTNNWDLEITQDWRNNGTGSNDYFVTGDNVLFSDLGAANPLVNVVGNVNPGSITVNTTSTNYTFTGAGSIGGTGGLTITNTGSLTILTTNSYTGPTILEGGTLAVSYITNSGISSGIGAAPAAPNNLVFSGGTLNYIGPSGASTDHGITLTNSGGTLDISNGSSLTLTGLLAGPAGLTLVDTGTLTLSDTNTYAGTTTVSNGTLNLYNASAASTNTIVMAGGTLGLEVASSSQQIFSNALTVTADSTLVSAGENHNNVLGGAWTSPANVTLNVTIASGTFTVDGVMTNFSGTVELGSSAGTFRFNSGGGNTCFGSPTATIDLGTGSASLQARNAGTMNIGALEGGSGTFVKGQGSDNGLLTWVIGGSISNPNTIFAGTIENNTANEVAAVTKVGAGTLFLAGQNTFTGSTIISNGILSLTNISGTDASISGSANILLEGGSLDVSGLSTGTLTLSSGQTLAGTGTLTGSLDGTSGVIAPGSPSLGNLYVTNSVTLGSSILMNLYRGGAPSNNSITAASINLNNTSLTVSNLGGALQVGDTFTLFSGAISGTFNTPIVLPPAYNWNTTIGANSVTIQVISQLRPTFSATSTLVGNVLTLNATGGPANGNWTLLDSTNVDLPLSQWGIVTTGTLNSSGDLVSYPVTINPAVSPEFYILQLPP